MSSFAPGPPRPAARGWTWCLLASLGLVTQVGAIDPSLRLSQYDHQFWRSDNSGLPNNSVRRVGQSEEGHLWIATRQGLARFDGRDFVTVDQGSAPDLGSAHVLDLAVDFGGRVWFTTRAGGLNLFLNESVSHFGAAQGLTDRPLRRMLKTGPAELLLISDTDLYRFDVGVGRGRPLASLADRAGQQLTSLLQMPDGTLFVGSNRGVLRLREGTLESVNSASGIEAPGVRAMTRLDGDIWLATDAGLFRWNGVDDPEPVGGDNVKPVSFLVDHHDRLWVGAEDGVLHRITDGHIETHELPPGFSLSAFEDIHQSADGDIWIGTRNGGLHRLTDGLFVTHSVSEGLPEAVARAVLIDGRGDVWVAGTHHVSRLTPDGPECFSLEDELGVASPSSLAIDRHGELWAGTESGALFRYVANGFQPATVVGLPRRSRINAIHFDVSNRIWLATADGLQRLLPDLRPDIGFARRTDRPTDAITAIFPADNGDIWFGTENDGPALFVNRHFVRSFGNTVLDSAPVRSFFEDDRHVWIGTDGDGLFRWEKTTGAVEHFDFEDGLASDDVLYITEAAEGSMWFTSRNGIYSVERHLFDQQARDDRPLVCDLFGSGKGIRNPECVGGFQPSGATDENGRVVVPTRDGVVSFWSDRFQPEPVPWPLVLEKITIDGRTYFDTSQPLVIPPGSGNVIEFSFTRCQFSSEEVVQFFARLTPLDREWEALGSRRVKEYVNLPPGEYEFHLQSGRGGEPDGIGPPPVAVVIEPHLYQRAAVQFGALFTILALLVAWRLHARRTSLRIAELEKQHAVDLERTRIARDMHDDVGATLTQIALLGDLASREVAERSTTSNYLGKMTTLTREVYRMMEEIVWAVSPRHDTLEEFVDYVCRYAEEFFSVAHIKCRYEVPVDLPAFPLASDVRHQLFMVIKEAFNNIARHAGATKVIILIRVDDGRLLIGIHDDGRGFEMERFDSTADGLQNMRARLRAVNAELDLSSALGSGTTVKISLPLKPPARQAGRRQEKPGEVQSDSSRNSGRQ